MVSRQTRGDRRLQLALATMTEKRTVCPIAPTELQETTGFPRSLVRLFVVEKSLQVDEAYRCCGGWLCAEGPEFDLCLLKEKKKLELGSSGTFSILAELACNGGRRLCLTGTRRASQKMPIVRDSQRFFVTL